MKSTRLAPRAEVDTPLYRRVSMAQVCDWCAAPTSRKFVVTGGGHYGGSARRVVSAEPSLCKRCGDHTVSRRDAWRAVQREPVEVLSVTAAEIVRAKFKPAEIRDAFQFSVTEPEQLSFGVWREGRQNAGYVQTRSGRYVSLHESFDMWVPFTLAVAQYPGTYYRDPFKAVFDYAGRFWGGVSKIAKVAGVLAPVVAATRRPRPRRSRQAGDATPEGTE